DLGAQSLVGRPTLLVQRVDFVEAGGFLIVDQALGGRVLGGEGGDGVGRRTLHGDGRRRVLRRDALAGRPGAAAGAGTGGGYERPRRRPRWPPPDRRGPAPRAPGSFRPPPARRPRAWRSPRRPGRVPRRHPPRLRRRAALPGPVPARPGPGWPVPPGRRRCP